jgi:hypothetical protein
MEFKLWLEDKSQTISYDFDGVLHASMTPGTTHPMDFWNWDEWEPKEEMHAQLRKDAQNHRIIVISKRDFVHQRPMWKFIRKYNLPIEKIYTTDNQPKGQTISDLGVIRHYDDDPRVGRELEGSGVEFILVR